MLMLGIAYMIFARRWLATPDRDNQERRRRPHLSEWIEEYGLAERAHRLRITPGSPLVGRTLAALNLRGSAGVNVIAIERSGRFARNVVRPLAGTELHAGDVLFIDLLAPTIDIEEICRQFALEPLPRSSAYFADRSQEIGMVEVMIPPISKLIGRTVVELRFRSEYDLAVIGLKHGSAPHSASLLHEPLKLGDLLLLVGPWKAIRRLQSDWKDLIVLELPAELDDVVPAASRAPYALLSLALVVGSWSAASSPTWRPP
jgi:uncharacterized protein with PhoU and TrkA domain